MIMLLKFKIMKPNYEISLTNPSHDGLPLVVIETNNGHDSLLAFNT